MRVWTLLALLWERESGPWAAWGSDRVLAQSAERDKKSRYVTIIWSTPVTGGVLLSRCYTIYTDSTVLSAALSQTMKVIWWLLIAGSWYYKARVLVWQWRAFSTWITSVHWQYLKTKVLAGGIIKMVYWHHYTFISKKSKHTHTRLNRAVYTQQSISWSFCHGHIQQQRTNRQQ